MSQNGYLRTLGRGIWGFAPCFGGDFLKVAKVNFSPCRAGCILLSCPFCGSSADVECIDSQLGLYTVVCSSCFASSNAYGIAEDAVEAWNKRA